VLRDNLIARSMPRVVAVSSAMTGDGKTTLATNLALSLSERARVLLVDANFERPGLATLFEILDGTLVSRMNGPGLAPYTVLDYSPTLAVAALLAREGVPPPRFEKWAFEQLLGTFRRMPVDHFIIDTAAVSASPTVGQLLGVVDAVLVAVRAGVTTARALRRATDMIPHGRGIGVAILDTNPDS
jgi:Mrp family chromosome partitioning ATPase